MRKKPDTKIDEGFLSRWARKKSTPENLPDVVDEMQEQNEELTNDVLESPSEYNLELTDEDMPAVESLDENSDYSGFLSPGVSDELRQLALRKLFQSEKFNIRDGLDDYDDDFRSFAALGDLITSDMRHQIELEQEKQKLAEQENTDAEQSIAQIEEQSTEEDMQEQELLNPESEVNLVENDETSDDTKS